MRDDHREDHRKEQNVSALELELRQAITDNGAGEHLCNAAEQRKRSRIEQRFEILIVVDDRFIGIQRRIFRNQLDHNIDKVLPAHKRTGDL